MINFARGICFASVLFDFMGLTFFNILRCLFIALHLDGCVLHLSLAVIKVVGRSVHHGIVAHLHINHGVPSGDTLAWRHRAHVLTLDRDFNLVVVVDVHHCFLGTQAISSLLVLT